MTQNCPSQPEKLPLEEAIDRFLSTPPTTKSLNQARSLLDTRLLDFKNRKLLNEWVELCQAHLIRAGSSDKSALDHYLNPPLLEISKGKAYLDTEPPERIPVLNFDSPIGLKVQLIPNSTIKESLFGKIKRAPLVAPVLVNNNNNNNNSNISLDGGVTTTGKCRQTKDWVALKYSDIESSTSHQRKTTGEIIFEDAQKEIAILVLLNKFSHSSILPLLMYGQLETKLITVFPLGKQSLWDRIQNNFVDYEYVLSAKRQIGSAIHFLHSIGFAHRDVSLENILEMEDGTLKLIDFGLSVGLTLKNDYSGEWLPIRFDQKDGKTYLVGKLRYLGPEFFLGTSFYDAQKADIFGLGICLFLMLYRGFPYQRMYSQANEAPTAEQLRTFWHYYDENMMNFPDTLDWLKGMLTKNPVLRSIK